MWDTVQEEVKVDTAVTCLRSLRFVGFVSKNSLQSSASFVFVDTCSLHIKLNQATFIKKKLKLNVPVLSLNNYLQASPIINRRLAVF